MMEVKSVHLGSKKVIISMKAVGCGNCSLNFDDIELMQYTGLKDKNGVEIYEGDILREYSNDIEDWIVSFENDGFVGEFENVVEHLYEISDLEVIGNIYENKDLIQKVEEEWL